jgi:hypothetical protein
MRPPNAAVEHGPSWISLAAVQKGTSHILQNSTYSFAYTPTTLEKLRLLYLKEDAGIVNFDVVSGATQRYQTFIYTIEV